MSFLFELLAATPKNQEQDDDSDHGGDEDRRGVTRLEVGNKRCSLGDDPWPSRHNKGQENQPAAAG